MVEPLSIQEMLEKTEAQRKNITQVMDSEGAYDFELANLYTLEGGKRVGQEDEARIRETLKNVPLKYFFKHLKEMMSSSGTTGIAGARYLIPDKIHTTIYDASIGPDIVPDISMGVITDIPGQSLKVDIMEDGSYIAKPFSSGGKLPDDEIKVVQATITPTSFGIALRVTNDMIEDTPQVDLINWHLNRAGQELGETATTMALTVLATGTDGDGTINTVAADTANETNIVTIISCQKYIVADEWEPNTLVIHPEAFLHKVLSGAIATYPYGMNTADWVLGDFSRVPYGTPGRKFLGMNTIFSTNPYMYTTVTSNLATACKTFVFDKSKALLTGRKRWARIERYSDPVRDLVGAVVSARQDSVTVYNDAIAKITNG